MSAIDRLKAQQEKKSKEYSLYNKTGMPSSKEGMVRRSVIFLMG